MSLRELTEPIIQWLEKHLSGDTVCELVSDHPWATTYRFEAENGTFYLKILPSHQINSLEIITQLANHFPEHIPEVVATSQAHQLVLLRDHQGKEISSSHFGELEKRTLATYAELQARGATKRELLEAFRHDSPTLLPTQFLKFFTPKVSAEYTAPASHFLGEIEAQKYADRLALRLPILDELIRDAVEQLPKTINHGDLRYKNVALRSDGSIILIDWDDAIAAPAGYSLHNFFSGCSRPAALLLGLPSATNVSQEQRMLMNHYMSELTRHGYATHDQLVAGLPGSFCLGVMAYVLSYAKYPIENADAREVIAKIIQRRTDDLLKLCDELSLRHRTRAVQFSQDHLDRGDFHEAARLMQRYLQAQPSDHEIRHQYATALYAHGDNSEALQQCRLGLEQNPWHPDLRRLSGDCALEDLDLDKALDHWNLAVQQCTQQKELRAWIADIKQLRDDIEALDAAETVPTVRLTETTLQSDTLTRLKARVATRLFREFGTLVLENAFSRELLATLHHDFLEKYNPLLQGGHVENALKVGSDRYMMTLDIEGTFNSPAVYANPFLQLLLNRLLGTDYILGSFTAVASLAGAPDMRVHKDHPALFPEDNTSLQIPTFGVTVLLPLLGMTSELGTTRVVKGSHRKSSEDAACMPYQDPLGPPGSCLLMDYRLTHQGLANRSNQVRPVLSMVYNRPWFRDAVNYKKQPPLSITSEEFGRVPAEHQKLFQWNLTHQIHATG